MDYVKDQDSVNMHIGISNILFDKNIVNSHA